MVNKMELPLSSIAESAITAETGPWDVVEVLDAAISVVVAPLVVRGKATIVDSPPAVVDSPPIPMSSPFNVVMGLQMNSSVVVVAFSS